MFEKQMKTFYDKNGYLVVKSLFDPEELTDVIQRTNEIVANPKQAPDGISIGREGDTVTDKSSSEAQNQSIRALAFLVRFDPIFHPIAKHPKLLSITRGLIGPRIKVFRDQMLLKPPGGQAKPPHQDQSYFRVQPANDLITAWIALDEATDNNGCICYVPGSHTHGVFDITHDPERPVHHVPDTKNLDLPDPVACPVPAGSVIFHHGCTLHHSETNHTNTWRKALILHYATSDSHSEREKLNEEVSLEID
jgi:ectoine hydroxylase-related dioxygenase (phytanoyl-CoA dioxygenase family)